MEAVLRIMEKTRRTRAKEEQIASLETENAILHIKTAQLQHTIKELLASVKPRSVETERCRKCDAFREKTVLLDAKIKSLRKHVTELQNHHSSLRQQIGNKLQNLQAVLPAIIQQHTTKQNYELQAKYFRERCRRKALHNTLVELRGNIRVHCRVRPVLDFDRGAEQCIRCTDDETVRVNYSQRSVSGIVLQEKAFEFDRVHPPSDSQGDVFSEIQPLIVSLLDGYNVCVMAYGQTGSGKTHTMLGSLYKAGSERGSGVLPSAVRELFRLKEEREIDAEVSVSVVEIYNEKIRDLLQEKSVDGAVRRHEIVTNRNGSTEVTNLTTRRVSSSEELLGIVSRGIRQRAVTSTLIHDHSSRSHLTVTVHISQAPSSPGQAGNISAASSAHSLDRTITPVHSAESTPVVSPDGSPPFIVQNTSNLSKTQKSCTRRNRRHFGEQFRESYVKLQFVDLAGSECIGMSGASGSSMKEAQYINKSLSSLSDVLKALAEKRSHVPYRNSTLTHLLQDTIGGEAKMVMLLCVSPTVQYVGESVRVLRFGERARKVQKRRANHSAV